MDSKSNCDNQHCQSGTSPPKGPKGEEFKLKECSVCKKSKKLKEYHKKRDGKDSRCKQCVSSLKKMKALSRKKVAKNRGIRQIQCDQLKVLVCEADLDTSSTESEITQILQAFIAEEVNEF